MLTAPAPPGDRRTESPYPQPERSLRWYGRTAKRASHKTIPTRGAPHAQSAQHAIHRPCIWGLTDILPAARPCPLPPRHLDPLPHPLLSTNVCSPRVRNHSLLPSTAPNPSTTAVSTPPDPQYAPIVRTHVSAHIATTTHYPRSSPDSRPRPPTPRLLPAPRSGEL